MTIDEMIARKDQLGLTYEQLANRSGVPIATIQKIFGKFTKSPRYMTMQALESALWPDDEIWTSISSSGTSYVADEPVAFRVHADDSDHITESERGEYAYRTDQLSDEKSAYGQPAQSDRGGHDAWFEDMFGRRRKRSCTLRERDSFPEEVRTEIIDGVLYDMASPGIVHQILQSEISFQLKRYIEDHGGKCLVLTASTDVRIDESMDSPTVLVPDVLVLCDPDKLSARGLSSAPDLVIEILSKSTQARDRYLKLAKYAIGGTREYWIVDPDRSKVIVYTFASSMPEQESSFDTSIYGFGDQIPVQIYNGECLIDFAKIQKTLQKWM